MTTIIQTSATADFAKLENPASQSTGFTTSEPVPFPESPIGTGSPLFKLAVLISRCFVRLFGPTPLVPDLLEEADADYPMSWPCCS